MYAQDILDEIRLDRDVAAPGWGRDGEAVRAIGGFVAECREDAFLLGRRYLNTAERSDAIGSQQDRPLPTRKLARTEDLARLAAAEFEDEPGSDLSTPKC